MRERRMGKGASRRAGAGRVRRATFSASCQFKEPLEEVTPVAEQCEVECRTVDH